MAQLEAGFAIAIVLVLVVFILYSNKKKQETLEVKLDEVKEENEISKMSDTQLKSDIDKQLGKKPDS